jgi:hypothetical protein
MIYAARAVGAQDFAAFQVFQVRQYFENRKPVVEGRKVTIPELFGDLVGGSGAAINQRYDARATLGVMLLRFADPLAMAGERRAVRGQDQIHIQRGDAIERRQKFTQGIVAGLPSDVGGDMLQNVIAGNQDAPLPVVQANMAG